MLNNRFLPIAAAALLSFATAGCAVRTVQPCQLVQQRPTMSDLKELYRKYNNVPIVIAGDVAYYCPCAERTLGAGTGSRTVGGDTESRKLGGDAEARKIGGDVEARTLGGDTEARKLGGDTERRALGGDTETRKLGGDTEARKLGGDVEARTLGGDTETRKLGGDTEARKLGGDTERRKTGGDIGTLSCATHERCGYFTLKGVRTPVQFFDGTKIRTVMPGKCVE